MDQIPKTTIIKVLRVLQQLGNGKSLKESLESVELELNNQKKQSKNLKESSTKSEVKRVSFNDVEEHFERSLDESFDYVEDDVEDKIETNIWNENDEEDDDGFVF